MIPLLEASYLESTQTVLGFLPLLSVSRLFLKILCLPFTNLTNSSVSHLAEKVSLPQRQVFSSFASLIGRSSILPLDFSNDIFSVSGLKYME
jgi:hypothetical protein